MISLHETLSRSVRFRMAEYALSIWLQRPQKMINKTIKWRIFTHIINIHNSTITNEHGSNSIASHQLLLNLHFSQASSTSTQSVHVLTVTQSVFIPTPFKISIWFPNCHRIYKMHTIPNCSSLSEKARRLLHYPRTNEKVWLPLSEVVEISTLWIKPGVL